MYNLLHRIPDGLDPLRTRFEEYVKRVGLSSVERVVTDDKEPVRSLFTCTDLFTKLKIHLAGTETLCGSIAGSAYKECRYRPEGFPRRSYLRCFTRQSEPDTYAMQLSDSNSMSDFQACRDFINRNKATGTHSNKSPELVAKYADALLKKSNKAGEEADLDAALRNTVSHFSVVCMPYAVYSRMLNSAHTDDGLQVPGR